MSENVSSQMATKMDMALGGQAVMEGVMIRAPHHIVVAVRKPTGKIVVKKEEFRKRLFPKS